MLKERKLMQECMIELADPIGTWVFNSHEAAEKSQEMHIRTILPGQEREIYPAASISLWSSAVVGQCLNSPAPLGCTRVCQRVLLKEKEEILGQK